MADIELRLLANLSETQTISDSSAYAATHNLQHNQLVGVIKSLLAAGLIEGEVYSSFEYCIPANISLRLLLPQFCVAEPCACWSRSNAMQALH